MAQVRVAAGAGHAGAAYAEGVVVQLFDGFFCDRLPEAGPPGARLKLRFRTEQRGAAADAAVDSRLMVVPVLPRERHLRAVVPGDVVGAGRELLPPFVITFDHFGDMHYIFALAGISEFHDRDFLRLARRDRALLRTGFGCRCFFREKAHTPEV